MFNSTMGSSYYAFWKKVIYRILFLFLFAGTIEYVYAGQPIQKQAGSSNVKRALILGDSITQDGTYVSFVEYYLESMFPDDDFDIISIGLSSETVSGLSEPTHPYPRPCVHERLDRALEMIKPEIVVACYGMNDGIYSPQSPERMQAFEDGVMKLINKVKAAGAELILLTPPVFDPKPIPQKVQPAGLEDYAFAKPYVNYDEVLSDYSAWIMKLKVDGVTTMDLHTPMKKYLNKQRLQDSTFSFSKDGVHPLHLGHLLMAREILKGIGIPLPEVDLNSELQRIESDSLYTLVAKHRSTRSNGWLQYVGYTKGETVKIDDIAPTEKEVAEIQSQVNSLRGKN